MASIKLDRVTRTFGTKTAVSNVSLEVPDREFLVLLGPSGCGKSTLLRMLAGLESVSSGEIHLNQRRVDQLPPSARDMAFVFQSYALYPHLTVFDNIAVPLRMRRHSALARTPLLGRLLPGRARTERGIREEVERVAAQLELSSLLRRKPGQLSGGQRQRVAVGRAIVRQPLGFLFDEPLSNLDAKLRVHMRTELAQLHRQLKATFVYVTHDQAEAMTMSSRIAVMIEGHIVQVGTPAEVYENPQDIRVAEFVGSPKINALPGVIREDGGLEVLGRPLGLSTPAAAGRCSVCVRPERMELGAGPSAISGTTISGTVVHLEHLGSEAFVHVKVDRIDLPLLARLNPDRQLPAIGSSIHLTYSANAARIFDAAGKRIEVAALLRSGRVLEQAVG